LIYPRYREKERRLFNSMRLFRLFYEHFSLDRRSFYYLTDYLDEQLVHLNQKILFFIVNLKNFFFDGSLIWSISWNDHQLNNLPTIDGSPHYIKWIIKRWFCKKKLSHWPQTKQTIEKDLSHCGRCFYFSYPDQLHRYTKWIPTWKFGSASGSGEVYLVCDQLARMRSNFLSRLVNLVSRLDLSVSNLVSRGLKGSPKQSWRVFPDSWPVLDI
jgi:hypothetical protein